MASNSPTKLSLFLILLITFTCTQSEAAQLHEETKMTVYIPATPDKRPQHHRHPHRRNPREGEGLEESSAQIGRAKGIFVISSLDGSIAHVLLSLVGTNEEYNGITIEIQGASRQLDKAREEAVVGGTGRYARGYYHVTFETVYLDLANSYSVIRCNITLAPNLLPDDRQRPE